MIEINVKTWNDYSELDKRNRVVLILVQALV